MSFFYTSAAGLIDLIVFAAVSAIVLAAGVPRARLGIAIMWAVYLADRLALAKAPYDLIMVTGSAVELAAMFLTVALVRNKLGGALATLAFVKMAAYTACMAGLAGFDEMATAATLAVYAQLLLLAGLGMPWHGLFKDFRHHRHGGLADHRMAAVVARRGPSR